MAVLSNAPHNPDKKSARRSIGGGRKEIVRHRNAPETNLFIYVVFLAHSVIPAEAGIQYSIC